MEMKKLMLTVFEWLCQGENVALATIIADSGSSPRGAGARMAIISDGSFVGTIGGGAVEYKVQQIALETLKNKKSIIETFILSSADKKDLGMICGGNVAVYIQYISALNSDTRDLFLYGSNLFSQNIDSWLVTDITKETDWRMGIYAPDLKIGSYMMDSMREKGFFTNRGVQIEALDRKYYSEPLTRAGKVFIFGGGHISRELTPLLANLGFCCTVFDSLPKFACKEAFPTAERVVVGDFDDISADVNITGKDYVVIMTRGHSSDFTVQAQALRCKPLYIGVIGSRRKIAVISERLLAQGFSQEEIDCVHAPIGIEIKSVTPAEIAVSIAAELIMVRAQAVECERNPL